MKRKPVPSRRGDDDEFDRDKDAFYVSSFAKDDKSRIYNIFIYSAIRDVEQFIPAVECLQIATEQDVVVVHLSTPGGDVDATDTFLQALAYTRARVIFVASGGVHSAGTLILMHADEVVLSENFNALVHNGSVGFGSKFSDFKSASRFALEHMENLFRRCYRGFLTEQELEELVAGKDFWFTADEFTERLQKRNDLLEAEEKSE